MFGQTLLRLADKTAADAVGLCGSYDTNISTFIFLFVDDIYVLSTIDQIGKVKLCV